MSEQKCGYIAIVGRPNVGKSTLLNNILGQKLSITSRKPQTTRHQILGMKTTANVQAIYVDTPGLHEGYSEKALNRYINKVATTAINDVDLVVFLIDRTKWMPEDQSVLEKIQASKVPCILVINKLDHLADKQSLLPYLEEVSQRHDFKEVFPISAKTGYNVAELEAAIARQLPEGMHFYDEDQFTDRSARFLAAELVREKIMRLLGDELPYSMTVEIEQFEESENLITIHALILVERDGQKKILIGDKGERIKQIGRAARLDMEDMFGMKVMLHTWVKVKSGWSDDERALKSLGYNDLD
ncbi:GTPase Era [Bermanella marisrubri]|uniref:GTPase Era n=1 Tax=Bermanella marisrubri TaxID=207949 RepID=Q1MXP7_9GAMM|nr:GTPase Era [Bermanella marisrubri]EAT10737.1 GTP-binding protein Era [Oceanobacter sp. RED65] [Bermanella marisrubri]QIZ83598.1 GTPase Era [Bermanella marisrubri]